MYAVARINDKGTIVLLEEFGKLDPVLEKVMSL